MKIKLLQLNMWAGTKWDAFTDFIKQNAFDIICLQEVTGIGTQSGNVRSNRDCFQELQTILGATHNGELFISQYTSSNPKTGYFGNAIFYKKKFLMKKRDELWLFKRATLFPSNAKSFEEVGRNLLRLTLELDNKTLEVVTTHLAWAKTKEEQPPQREQNLKLIEYMKHVDRPWVLTGDFNIDTHQQSILDLEKLGRDLTKEYAIPNTIDGTIHVSWERLKPGFPIDYIFVSPDIRVNHFEALEHVHMSDHIGLVAEVEI